MDYSYMTVAQYIMLFALTTSVGYTLGYQAKSLKDDNEKFRSDVSKPKSNKQALIDNQNNTKFADFLGKNNIDSIYTVSFFEDNEIKTMKCLSSKKNFARWISRRARKKSNYIILSKIQSKILKDSLRYNRVYEWRDDFLLPQDGGVDWKLSEVAIKSASIDKIQAVKLDDFIESKLTYELTNN